MAIKKYIDLNCDVAEFHPITGTNNDEEILPFISSCNVCCTYHSGSAFQSAQTIKLAVQNNVAIGAHPSYNDLENFGRKSLQIDLGILKEDLRFQIGAIKTMTESLGGILNHVKPHGALYNDMIDNLTIAQTVIDVIVEIDPNLKLYGMADSKIKTLCSRHNITFINEVFADRQYQDKYKLRSRQSNNALIHEPKQIIERIKGLLNNNIVDYQGNTHSITVDSICIHSDTSNAILLVRDIYNFIKSTGVDILSIR